MPCSCCGNSSSSAESRKVARSASSVAWATVPPGSPSIRHERLPGWSSRSIAAVRAASRTPPRSAAPTSGPVAVRRTCSRRRVRRSRVSRLMMRSRASTNSITAPPRITADWNRPSPGGRVTMMTGETRQASPSRTTKRQAVASRTLPVTGRGRAIVGSVVARTTRAKATNQPAASSGRSVMSAASPEATPVNRAASSRRAEPSAAPTTAKPSRVATASTSRWPSGKAPAVSELSRSASESFRTGSISTIQPTWAAATVTTRASSRLSRSCRMRSRWKAVTAPASTA